MEAGEQVLPEEPRGNDLFSRFDGLALDAIKSVNAKGPAVSKIHHYTDAQGLIGIIREGKLWLTDTKFLNDGSEITFALEACGRELSRFMSKRPKRDQAFAEIIFGEIQRLRQANRAAVFCTSTDGNLLNQWRDYGKGKVCYSIEFDIEKLFNFEDSSCDLTFARVIYQQEQQTLLLRKIFRSVHGVLKSLQKEYLISNENEGQIALRAAAEIARTLYWIKNSGFDAEREVRAMMDVPSLLNSGLRPEFRPSNLGIVPYFIWQWNTRTGKLPITGVTVGPSTHSEMAMEAVQALLISHGYNMEEIHILYSKIHLQN